MLCRVREDMKEFLKLAFRYIRREWMNFIRSLET